MTVIIWGLGRFVGKAVVGFVEIRRGGGGEAVLEIEGSFSIDDGNCRENVSFKMNSLFFNLCRVYSSLLKMASVGEFPWS